ncbi:TOMM precursor leader peptide-binding protein [Candidatus Uabimicrobium amorphum]|uniref:TOMM leader peptide-binding protein n=1 Tax=Uabimicrobium amorphum TaxID=2596890 RepID=A0A5S9ILH0_UABAM|nr:TOMM precursor leader peptide-binding protein [Candidatus Uabimicrobium amorphum]BBM83531.1 hypothetical protein UABAM_01883 [Candidatus Uabimicrobium amorphum]
MDYPVISPLYTLIKEKTQIQFRRDDQQAIFVSGDNSLLSDLLPLLNGENTTKEILKALPNYPKTMVLELLKDLQQQGIVIEKTLHSCAWKEITATQKDISTLVVCILSHEIYTKRIRDNLSLLGVNHFTTIPREANISIVCEPGLTPSFIQKWNEDHRVSWLRVSWTTSCAEVGPLFIPQQTACYQCFQQRLLSNRRFRDSYGEYQKIIEQQGIPLKPFVPSFLWCMSQVAMELLRYGTHSQLCGRLLYMEWDTSQQFIEQVLRIPHCMGSCC